MCLRKFLIVFLTHIVWIEVQCLYNFRNIGIVCVHIGVVCVHIGVVCVHSGVEYVRNLKKKTNYFSSASFFTFVFLVFILGENIDLSLWLFSIDVYAGKIWSKYIPKSKFKTNSWAQNLRQGIIIKTSFGIWVSRMGLGSFVDFNIFVMKNYFILFLHILHFYIS